MRSFNNGRPYHGSEAVEGGKLRGATDTDYFYFFCPRCPGKHILRVLEYAEHAQEPVNPYNEQLGRKAHGGFTLVFKLYCEQCRLTDFVKVSNTGWQGGDFDKLPTQRDVAKGAVENAS